MTYIYLPGIKHAHEWKPCEQCGEVRLIQRRRRFCSYRCSKMGPNNPMWKGDEAKRTSARMRSHHLEIDRQVCTACGAVGEHQRHHADENVYNNDLSNLQVLCTQCHGRAHRVLPRPNCKICGLPCPRPRAKYCSQKCMGIGFSKGGQ